MKKHLFISNLFFISLVLLSCTKVIPSSSNLHLLDLGNDVKIHTQAQIDFLSSSSPKNYFRYDCPVDIPNPTSSYPNSVKFTWSEENEKNVTANKYLVEMATDEQFTKNVMSYTTKKQEIEITNLFVNTTYYWRVTAIYGSTEFPSLVSSFTTEQTGPRNIYVEGVINMRDLGGWEIGEGKTFKQGLIYRSAQFNYDKKDDNPIVSSPTKNGQKTLINDLKIKSDVDIRNGEEETLGITSSPISPNVHYEYLPMVFGGSNIFTKSENKENIKKFLEFCAVEENYPLVFHCSRGADRTGALAYAIMALCGVNEENLMKDYYFTGFADVGSIAEIDGLAFYPYQISQCAGNTYQEQTFNYLVENIGVSKSTLNKIVDILTD